MLQNSEPRIMPEQRNDDDDRPSDESDERAPNVDVIDDEGAECAVSIAVERDDDDPDAGGEIQGASVVRGHSRRSFIHTPDQMHFANRRWREDSWQIKALKIITSQKVELFFACLLLLDVLILFTDLGLDSFFPQCYKVVENGISCCPIQGEELNAEGGINRFLEGDGYESTDHSICAYPLVDMGQVGCDEHKYSAVHLAHLVLYYTTVVILVTFEVELLSLLYLLGPVKFFHLYIYVLDLIVVTVSLAFELLLHNIGYESAADVLPSLFILFRMWRFVRIGHGLVASAHDMGREKIHLALDHINKLEEILKTNGLEVPVKPKKLIHEEEQRIEQRSTSKTDMTKCFCC